MVLQVLTVLRVLTGQVGLQELMVQVEPRVLQVLAVRQV